jgi:hypothetical protein
MPRSRVRVPLSPPKSTGPFRALGKTSVHREMPLRGAALGCSCAIQGFKAFVADLIHKALRDLILLNICRRKIFSRNVISGFRGTRRFVKNSKRNEFIYILLGRGKCDGTLPGEVGN